MSNQLQTLTHVLYKETPKYQQLTALERAALFPEHLSCQQQVAMVFLNTLYYIQVPHSIFRISNKHHDTPAYQRMGVPMPQYWLSKDATITPIKEMANQHLTAVLRMAQNGKLNAFNNPRNVKYLFSLADSGPITFSEYTQETLAFPGFTDKRICQKLRSEMHLTRVEGVIDLMRLYQELVIMQRNYHKWHLLDERYYNLLTQATERGLIGAESDLRDETFQEVNRYKQLSLTFGSVMEMHAQDPGSDPRDFIPKG